VDELFILSATDPDISALFQRLDTTLEMLSHLGCTASDLSKSELE
jgi:hypothetical protein